MTVEIMSPYITLRPNFLGTGHTCQNSKIKSLKHGLIKDQFRNIYSSLCIDYLSKM